MLFPESGQLTVADQNNKKHWQTSDGKLLLIPEVFAHDTCVVFAVLM